MQLTITLITLTAAAGLFTLASPLTPRAAYAEENSTQTTEVATFAGGCFWCLEGPFDKLDGVIATISGYTGGSRENPTYNEVSSGGTGHYEAVQIEYDPSKVDYATLLDVFWRNIDPLDPHGQFCDKGDQYRSAIFVHTENQRELAEQSLQKIKDSGIFDAPIATPVLPAETFWPAEEYHQDYYLKNPIRYTFYRYNCGRDKRLEQLWGSGKY